MSQLYYWIHLRRLYDTFLRFFSPRLTLNSASGFCFLNNCITCISIYLEILINNTFILKSKKKTKKTLNTGI